MKIGIRKRNLKSSFKAKTTGKAKRAVKRTINPLYGKKGMGWLKNPKRAVYNTIYHRTTKDISDITKGSAKIKQAKNTKTKKFDSLATASNTALKSKNELANDSHSTKQKPGTNRATGHASALASLSAFIIGIICLLCALDTMLNWNSSDTDNSMAPIAVIFFIILGALFIRLYLAIKKRIVE